jgi:hypothetical protein
MFTDFPTFQMLNCILSMVEKTKRALGMLEGRAPGEDWRMEDHAGAQSRAHDIMTQTLRMTEDRVNQVKRKAGISNTHSNLLKCISALARVPFALLALSAGA